MSINKDEIDKYIFDPNNPKQCKSYGLLLNIAQKENSSYFSPEFLRYFFAEQVITEKFDDEIWDKPDNYDLLLPYKKLDLFEKLHSSEDLKDYIKNINFDINRISNYGIAKNILTIGNTIKTPAEFYNIDINNINKYFLLGDKIQYNKHTNIRYSNSKIYLLILQILFDSSFRGLLKIVNFKA